MMGLRIEFDETGQRLSVRQSLLSTCATMSVLAARHSGFGRVARLLFLSPTVFSSQPHH